MGIDCVDFEMDSRVADYVGDKSRDSVVNLVYLSSRGYGSPNIGTYEQDKDFWNRSAVRGKGTEVVGGAIFTINNQAVGGSILPRRWVHGTTSGNTITFADIRRLFEVARSRQLNFKTVVHMEASLGTEFVDAAHDEFMEYHQEQYPDNEVRVIRNSDLADSWIRFVTPAAERFHTVP